MNWTCEWITQTGYMNEVNQVLERFVYEKQNNSLCSSHKAYAHFRRLGISHMHPFYGYFITFSLILQLYSPIPHLLSMKCRVTRIFKFQIHLLCATKEWKCNAQTHSSDNSCKRVQINCALSDNSANEDFSALRSASASPRVGQTPI